MLQAAGTGGIAVRQLRRWIATSGTLAVVALLAYTLLEAPSVAKYLLFFVFVHAALVFLALSGLAGVEALLRRTSDEDTMARFTPLSGVSRPILAAECREERDLGDLLV